MGEENGFSLLGELERLAELHREGALDDDEFQAAKERLLAPRPDDVDEDRVSMTREEYDELLDAVAESSARTAEGSGCLGWLMMFVLASLGLSFCNGS